MPYENTKYYNIVVEGGGGGETKPPSLPTSPLLELKLYFSVSKVIFLTHHTKYILILFLNRMSALILLENLPRLAFCHILSFLSHLSLLNLSLSSKNLYGLVMREWNTNPSLWYHITISPDLSIGGFMCLWKIMKTENKLEFVRSIRISNSEQYLTNFMLTFLSHFHNVSRLVIETKIKSSHIIKILSKFNYDICKYCKNCKRPNINSNIQYVEFTKHNIVAIKLSKN